MSQKWVDSHALREPPASNGYSCSEGMQTSGVQQAWHLAPKGQAASMENRGRQVKVACAEGGDPCRAVRAVPGLNLTNEI